MSNIVLTTESPTDLRPELQEKYNIGIIPLHVTLGDNEYFDGVDITNQMIFEKYHSDHILPKTSAVAIAEYTDFFKKYLDEGKTIINISLSSGVSSTYQNACIAAEELKDQGKVYVIDSLALSQATGILLCKAAKLIEEGKTAEEIVAAVNEMIPKLDNTFCINSLEFLHKGGRCSALSALGANILKLKPCIELVEGKMTIAKKYRGKLTSAYLEYVDDRLKGVDYDDEYICISNCLLEQDTLDAVVKHLKDNYHFQNILVNQTGCTITAHGGKDCMSVFFLKK